MTLNYNVLASLCLSRLYSYLVGRSTEKDTMSIVLFKNLVTKGLKEMTGTKPKKKLTYKKFDSISYVIVDKVNFRI